MVSLWLRSAMTLLLQLGACLILVAPSQVLAEYWTSFSSDETIAGNLYADEDIVRVDGSSATLYESLTSVFTSGSQNSVDLDALFLDDNGDLYFSTTSTVFIDSGIDGGSGRMDSGDVVVRSAADGTFSRYIADAGPNIDAFWISNGLPYLSLGSDATIGSNSLAVSERMVFTLSQLTDLDGGLVSVVLDSTELLVPDGAEPPSSADIDAFAIADDGSYLFSTTGSNRFDLDEGGSLTRDSGVIYQVDPGNTAAFDPNSSAAIFADVSDALSETVNVDALHLATATPTIDADFNGDGSVALADYVVWRDSLGAAGLAAYDLGDANGDAAVDITDYNAWKSSFGISSTAIGLASSPVPEPTAWVSWLLVAMTAWVRRSLDARAGSVAASHSATEARV